MILLLFIIIVLILLEILFYPRLDFTRDKKILLWYGRLNRNFIVIFE
jgi:hypothetical protein